MATNHILGRSTSGTGNPEILSAAQVRTILNVENGATADQTSVEIKALLATNKLTATHIGDDAIGADQLAHTSVTAGSYGSSTSIPSFTVDSQGRITAASGNTVNTDLVGDTSPQLGGDLDTNSNHIVLNDTARLKFGTGDDFQIRHNGTDTTFAGSATTKFFNPLFEIYKEDGTKKAVAFNADSGQELYYNNSKTFETTSAGATVTGSLTVTNDITLQDNLLMGDTDKIRLGDSQDLELHHSSGENYIQGHTNQLYIRSAQGVYIQPNTNENGVVALANGAVELYYDNGKRCETTNTSFEVAAGYDFRIANSSTWAGNAYGKTCICCFTTFTVIIV